MFETSEGIKNRCKPITAKKYLEKSSFVLTKLFFCV